MTEIILDSELAPVELKTGDGSAFKSLITKGNITVRSVINGGVHHHNFLEYLAQAWKGHKGIVITPDVIWHVVLNEVASHIKDNPKKYQSLFSKSEGKVEISVPTGDAQLLPLDSILEKLRELVPTDVDAFLPDFSTKTDSSVFAMTAAFADAMSPFYNYSMYMCGISKVKVLGTAEDWDLFKKSLQKLLLALPKLNPYIAKVYLVILDIEASIGKPNADFWKGIFRLDRCGSGGQVEVKGWVQKLFMKQPSPGYINNYPTCVARVSYKNLTTDKNFELISGLFSSEETEDGYLVPDFGYIITEKQEVVVEVVKPKQELGEIVVDFGIIERITVEGSDKRPIRGISGQGINL